MSKLNITKLRLVDSISQRGPTKRTYHKKMLVTYETRVGRIVTGCKMIMSKCATKLSTLLTQTGRSVGNIEGEIQIRLSHNRINRQRLINKLKPVVMSTSLVIMVLIMLSDIGGTNIARAFDVLNQSDWSGGVGSSPVDQYTGVEGGVVTTTPGQLSVTGSPNSWCATANCNNNWTRRKNLLARGSFDPNINMTYMVIKLEVEYESEMKADFSDLRFTDRGSSTDIPYYIMRKTDGVSATVYIKSPLSGGSFDSNHFMYYGNAGASSLSSKVSVFSTYDQFDQGILHGSYYWVPSGAIVGDAARIDTLSSGFNGSYSADRSRTRIFEFDVKYHFDNLTCNDDIENGSTDIGYQSSEAWLSFYHPSDCDTNGQYWTVIGANIGSLGGISNNSGQPRFRDNQYVRFRMTAYKDGGQKFEYSVDGGVNYVVLSWIPISNDTFNTALHMGNGLAPATYRNVVSYESQDNTSGKLSLMAEVEEAYGGRMVGSLTSVEYDLGGDKASFREINAIMSGSGNVGFYVSGSATPGGTLGLIDMYTNCDFIKNGESIAGSNCLPSDTRYIRYAVYMADTSSHDLVIQDINLEYHIDNQAPTNASNVQVRRSSNNALITTGWVNESPKFSWDTSTDESNGSGVAGYCLYLGTDSGADLSTTQGILPVASPYDSHGLCQYAVETTSLDVALLSLQQPLATNTQYYFKIQPFDYAGNVSSATTTNIGYDTDAPSPYTSASGPNGYVNNPIQSINWMTEAPAMVADTGGSGVAGIKYCVFSYISGDGCSFFGGNTSDFPWYGPNRTNSSPSDTSDLYSFASGGLTLSNADLARMTDEGLNAVVLLLIDNAGNSTGWGSGGAPVIIGVTQQPPSTPRDLQATPASNTDNAFSFNWNAPSTLSGPVSDVDYCWTVNTSPAADGSNCNWTGKNITQLAQGAYATQQGVNTLYLMAKDQSHNFSNANVASVNFSATTTAPGPPQHLELSDISIRASSSWKIAMSWSAPQLPGTGIASYKIYRSTNNVSFTEVGTTSNSNLSFIDSGLTQTDYYYYVKACDNAGSCSVSSNTGSKYPSGRYTTPARLTDDTDQPKIKDISTRKATVYWFTDRASDSKIAYGTAPGQYFSEEVGNSTQTLSHAVSLSNLEHGKTYYYVARWTDEDGNTGVSEERSFTTLPAPTVREVSASGLTINSAIVNLTTDNAHKIRVHYGASDTFGGVVSMNTSSSISAYSVNLVNLLDGQKYYYKISTIDADGNEYQGDTYSFTTPARPRITNLRFETVEGEPSSTQKIVWTTNVLTTSEVAYGPTGGSQLDAMDSKLVTDHEMIIRGLDDNSDYTLIARSRDVTGNLAVSDKQFFQTAEDTRAPKVFDFKVETDILGSGGEARGQIVVYWRTDEPATSQVAFAQGRTSDLNNRSTQDSRLTREHVVVVSDMSTSNIYQVQAVSADKAGNESFSDTQTAIVGRGAENIFNIILNALQAIFGFGSSSL